MTLMGKGAGDIEDTELDWARELFGTARGEAEPVWGGDVAAITRAGDRRRRVRTARTGGGLLGVVAVTTAVAVTLGAGTTDFGSAAGPGGAWDNRKLQDVFQYAAVSGGGSAAGDVNYFDHVPRSAAADVAAMIGHLDPDGTHLHGSSAGPAREQPRIVGDDDSALRGAMEFTMDSTWTGKGSVPDRENQPGRYARLTYSFFKDVNVLGRAVPAPGGVMPQPCGLTVDFSLRMRTPDSKAPLPRWSECRYTALADGSKVATSSAAFGPGTETVAVRLFADGNVAALIGRDYPLPAGADWTGPADPATVLTPAPWSEAAFRAALSDPDIGPVFAPMPAPNADGKLLTPADLGPDWSYDRGQGATTTGMYVMEDGVGCAADERVSGLAPGRGFQYQGTVDGGRQVTLFEGEYRLPAGTGAATMREARTYAQSGCDPEPGSGAPKDTMAVLPSGIGDEAFIAFQPQRSTVRVNIRFGDTVLQLIVTAADAKPLDLTSAAETAWLEGAARQAAAHWTGGKAAGGHR